MIINIGESKRLDLSCLIGDKEQKVPENLDVNWFVEKFDVITISNASDDSVTVMGLKKGISKVYVVVSSGGLHPEVFSTSFVFEVKDPTKPEKQKSGISSISLKESK